MYKLIFWNSRFWPIWFHPAFSDLSYIPQSHIPYRQHRLNYLFVLHDYDHRAPCSRRRLFPTCTPFSTISACHNHLKFAAHISRFNSTFHHLFSMKNKLSNFQRFILIYTIYKIILSNFQTLSNLHIFFANCYVWFSIIVIGGLIIFRHLNETWWYNYINSGQNGESQEPGIAQLPFMTREMRRNGVNLTRDWRDSWIGRHRIQSMWNAQVRFSGGLVLAFLNGSKVGQAICNTEWSHYETTLKKVTPDK